MCTILTRDNELATDDAVLAKNTFRLDIGVLKANTTRSRHFPMQSQVIDVPREFLSSHEEVETSSDVFCVSGKIFASYISQEVHYKTMVPSNVTDKKDLAKAVDGIFQVCYKCGFQAVKFYCDKQFETAFNECRVNQDPIIKENCFNARECDPIAESNNRTVQEKARTFYYQMTHINLTIALVRDVVSEATIKLNLFPAKHVVSKYCSPRVIFSEENLDFK